MNSGSVHQVLYWFTYTVADLMSLLTTNWTLWGIPFAYYIIGFIMLGIVINYILR